MAVENINTTLTAINELKLNGWKIDNNSIKNGLLNVKAIPHYWEGGKL